MKNNRFASQFKIQIFIEDDTDLDEQKQQAVLKLNELKKRIEEIGSNDCFKGLIVQMGEVYLDKFGQI